MKERSWTKYWIKKFRNSEKYGQMRFKRLETGYPMLDIDESLIDVVPFNEFIKIEHHRLPLFIGSQFGIAPRMDKMPEFFNGRKLVAILNKSLLSGHVAGLVISEIKAEEQKFKNHKLDFFENIPN